MLRIRRKCELLKVDHWLEAASHRTVSGIPGELIERGSCCSAVDKRSVLRSGEFRCAQVSRRGGHVAREHQRFPNLSHTLPAHSLGEESLLLREKQEIGHSYGTTLACQQHRRSSAIKRLNVDFCSRIAAGQ